MGVTGDGALRRGPRPGHHLDPVRAVRSAGPDGVHRPARASSVLPATRLGRARCRRDLVHRQENRSAGAGRRRCRAASRWSPSASPTSARRRSSGIGTPVFPVGRAIVWQDTRTSGALARIADELDPADVLHRTGLPMATYFSGSKLRWMLDHDPALRPAAERGDLLLGTMDTWITWNLTGGPGDPAAGIAPGLHVTDVDERQPHHADESGDAGLGGRPARGVRCAAGDAAADPADASATGGDRRPGAGHPRSGR